MNTITYSLLLIDDSPEIFLTVKPFAVSKRLAFSSARSIASSRAYIQRKQFDCIILDRMLPDGDGLEFLSEIRQYSPESRVLLLSCLGEVSHRVAGLECGADDYLPKPFAPSELFLRVSVLLERRKCIRRATFTQRGITVCDDSCTYTYNGRTLRLRKREYLLFQFLLRHYGRMLRRETLYEHLWTFHRYPTSSALDVCVKRLRRSLLGTGIIIETGYKVGYRLVVHGTNQTSSFPRSRGRCFQAEVQRAGLLRESEG